MPQNKQKLKAPGISILKDGNSLAYYNIRPGTAVSLGMKERGGRKKMTRGEENNTPHPYLLHQGDIFISPKLPLDT